MKARTYLAVSYWQHPALFIFLPYQFFIIFVIIYVSFYLYFVAKFIEYLTRFKYVMRAVSDISDDEDDIPMVISRTGQLEAELDALEHALRQYVDDKEYTRIDVNNEDTARLLKTDRALLTYYFKCRMNMDFRAWRTGLRVNEACQLILAHPEWTMKAVGEQAGFSDKANFYRQFKKMIGCTPAEYFVKASPATKTSNYGTFEKNT